MRRFDIIVDYGYDYHEDDCDQGDYVLYDEAKQECEKALQAQRFSHETHLRQLQDELNKLRNK